MAHLNSIISKKTIIHLIKYIVYGGVAKAIDVGLLYILTEFVGIWYFYSALISYLCSIFPNFFINKYFNFYDTNNKTLKQLSLFILINLGGLTLNQLLIFSFTESFHIWYLISKLLSMFFVMLFNFTLSNIFVFKTSEKTI